MREYGVIYVYQKMRCIVFLTHFYRPLIQKKLDVLSEAGLNKESFSDLDTKMFQVRSYELSTLPLL